MSLIPPSSAFLLHQYYRYTDQARFSTSPLTGQSSARLWTAPELNAVCLPTLLQVKLGSDIASQRTRCQIQ